MKYDFDEVVERRGTDSCKWGKYRGRDVLPMWVADMDFRSPPEVVAALGERVAHGIFGYAAPPEGLGEVVVKWMAERYGWAIREEWIVWLPGLVGGLNMACRSVGEAGDEVATFVPVYPPFLSAPGLAGRKLVRVPLGRAGGRYVAEAERLAEAVTERTKLLLWCHPHNPVGRAFSREEVAAIVRVCMERGIVICSDEIHCDLILDEVGHVPTAELGEEVAARTITLMAASKTFNVAGLNCALAIVPDEGLRRRFTAAGRGIVPEVNALGYAGSLAAFREGEPWRRALIEYLRGSRDMVEEAVGEMKGVRMDRVEATYLAWIDARELGMAEPAAFFEEAGVGLSDGRDFDGAGFVRLNFGCPRVVLAEGLERMKRAVGKK